VSETLFKSVAVAHSPAALRRHLSPFTPYVDVMTKLVEQDANERFGAERLGPFGKRQRLEVLRGQEVVQPGEASSPRSARVVAVAR
jgi:hypothetical protein